MDGNGKMYVMDVYDFLQETGKTHIGIKDI